MFYREWERRAPGETRDVGRARALAGALGVLGPSAPVLAVVGSKGKGTAATYASAFLAAAGFRVCTVTSPGLRIDRDRIRINGRAVSSEELAILSDALDAAMGTLPPPSDGYLSPSGLFLIAGVLHARRVGADALVLEAGMGGRSDEVALFPPDVAAITPVFLEHAGVLGDTETEIAREKLGVAAPGTVVLSAPQTAPVAAVLRDAEVVGPGGAGLPGELLPAGLGRAAAELGVAAARRLPGAVEPPAATLREVLASIVLPGRASRHAVPGSATEVLVDAAVDGAGIAAALAAARDAWGAVDHAVVCLPDHKDLDGAVAALGDLPVTFVRLALPHLRFTRPLPDAWDAVGADAITPESLATLGHRVAVLGTGYFTGHVLDVLGADTERLFVTSAARRPA
ncbi:dihydrofolate synthase / folylpolyglutamate synthase [Actinomadura meyerae]|uniref:Dihydrofolate synthase / folylpolyglutamate synthase n=1 Tax=Actinomadura meyerae TaxID=240840 RepID=A0A239N0U9_9ACTN|nr:dihydrofolate synthase / folylpolyglutamate synthase [Actinomadura meyerae]